MSVDVIDQITSELDGILERLESGAEVMTMESKARKVLANVTAEIDERVAKLDVDSLRRLARNYMLSILAHSWRQQ